MVPLVENMLFSKVDYWKFDIMIVLTWHKTITRIRHNENYYGINKQINDHSLMELKTIVFHNTADNTVSDACYVCYNKNYVRIMIVGIHIVNIKNVHI